MDITPLIAKGRQIINRYGNGGFVVNEVSHKGGVLILPDRVWPWSVAEMEQASEESFAPVLAHIPFPDILLIGAGGTFLPLPPALRNYLRGHGIAADVMDTGAACRTYNVLQSEERRVAAALIAVD